MLGGPKSMRMVTHVPQALSKLLCRMSIWGPTPSSKCQIPHQELGNNRKLVRALWKWPTLQGCGVLGGPCQEAQPLHRLPGAQKDPHLGARCACTRTCATADPSAAQDEGLASDYGKEIDSLQSAG